MTFNLTLSDLQLIWDTYKDFESFTRETDGDLSHFIEEWKKKMTKVQSAGCQYSDLLLGLKLIDKVNLNHDAIVSVISNLGSSTFTSESFLSEVVTKLKDQSYTSGSSLKQSLERGNDSGGSNGQEFFKKLEAKSNSVSYPVSVKYLEEESLSKPFMELHSDIFQDKIVDSKKGSSSGSGFLKCPICNKNFMLIDNLNKHIKNHENGITGFDEDSLGQEWMDSSELDTENQSVEDLHYNIKKEVINETCEDSGKKKASANASKSTKRSKSNGGSNKPIPRDHLPRVPCKICGKYFAKCGFAQHMQSHTAKTLNCSQCDKTYKDDAMLKKHVLLMHTKVEGGGSKEHLKEKKPNPIYFKYPCEVCGKPIAENCMAMHLKMHSSVAELQCDQCPKKWKLLSSLKKHMQIHKQKPPKKPIECKICHKLCKSTSNFKTHMQSHRTTRDYICSFCGKDYKTKNALDAHMNAHTKAKQFPCQMCEKVFFSANSLKFHVRAHHTGEKPFKCDICEKRFYTSSKKKEHMSIHTGAKPFPCHICGKYFRLYCTRRRHIRTVHKEVKSFGV